MSLQSAGVAMPGSSLSLDLAGGPVSRGAVFGAGAILGIVNGVSTPVLSSIASEGWAQSIFSLFGISLISWAGLIAATILLFRCHEVPARRIDAVPVILLLLLCVFPLADASWAGLTLLALYLLLVPSPEGVSADTLRRGAWVLLAATGPMFWGRLILQNSGNSLLAIDARMVALLTGMPRSGNLIQTAGDGGYLWIAPYCSSLTNISLALLCCTLAVQWQGLRWRRRHAVTCALACLAVATINDLRIAVMVWRPQLYDVVHGTLGLTLASWATVLAVIAIIWRGIGGAPRHAG